MECYGINSKNAQTTRAEKVPVTPCGAPKNLQFFDLIVK